MKLCLKCGDKKPATEFHKDASKSDGLRPYCKACAKTEAARYGAANREKKRAASAAYYAANRDKCRATSDAWQKANPEKFAAAKAEWREKNRDRNRAKNVDRYWADPEKHRARNAKWYADNIEAAREKRSKWKSENLAASRIHYNNRRARNTGKLSAGLSERLFKLQRGKCACCGMPLGDNYHLDHIMPLALGGTNDDKNIQLLRAECNLQKNAKHPIEFMRQRGFLL